MKDGKKTRILVADDQRLARMYVELQVKSSPRYELVASLSLADDVLDYLAAKEADLVLLDIVMERGGDGLQTAAKIKKLYPEIKIILCTSMAETEWMEWAKEIGVESFWYKEYSKIPLLEVIDRTVAGESVYSNEMLEAYLGRLPASALTPRQKDILRYLISGMTNREIAQMTCLSPNTVKSYIDNLMEASNIHSRTALAVAASRIGLSVRGK